MASPICALACWADSGTIIPSLMVRTSELQRALLAAGVFLAAMPGGAAGAALPAKIDFNRDIRPILSQNCCACHGPDASKRKAGLRFDLKESAFGKAKSGATAVVPGAPVKSDMIRRVTATDPDGDAAGQGGQALKPQQVALLKRWIQQGGRCGRGIGPLARPMGPIGERNVMAAMNDRKAMFRRAWITAGHSELWNCRGTYCEIPYETLPQVGRATNDLGWLDQISPELRRVIHGTSTLNSSDNEIANLEGVVAEARSLRLDLPEPFRRFMRDASLQDKVPSCTACFLALSENLIPVVGAEGHYLLRFVNDSQSCVLWYLCLSWQGEAGVVASDYFLEPEIFEAMEYEGVNREDVFQRALLCADTFTEFLYRFWVENTIWYSLRERMQLNPLQDEYRNQITRRL